MKNFKQLSLGAATAAFLCYTSFAAAGPLSLDFETAPGPDGLLGTVDDTSMPSFGWIRDQYASLGIVFTEGTVMQSTFFDGNATNHYLSSTNPIGYFTVPIYGIQVSSYSFHTATLSGFDAAGNLLASDRVIASDTSAVRSVLSITSNQPIASFSILPDQPNYILNLDNMVLATTVPEPGAPYLFAVGLGVLAWRRVRRSRF
jgi:hypothetical protein